MSEALDRAIAELVECDETQGGVTHALRVIAADLESLERYVTALGQAQALWLNPRRLS